MEHKCYKKIVPGADTAVLLIHGILGTPNHFRPILPLIPQGYSVYNLLLHGHGADVRDFSRSSMTKWEKQVSSAVEELSASHKNIYIAAHSMGTLLAIEQAAKCPKIKGLFLLAIPIKIHLKWQMVKNCAKVYLNRISEDDILAQATKDSCSIKLCNNPFLYLGWIPRYLELFGKINRTRYLLPLLSTPCYTYQSHYDEMVSRKATEYLRTHSQMIVTEFKDSTHFYYSPADLAFLQVSFSDFIEQKTEVE